MATLTGLRQNSLSSSWCVSLVLKVCKNGTWLALTQNQKKPVSVIGCGNKQILKQLKVVTDRQTDRQTDTQNVLRVNQNIASGTCLYIAFMPTPQLAAPSKQDNIPCVCVCPTPTLYLSSLSLSLSL